MELKRAETEQEIAAVKALWTEYWETLGLPLTFQGFGEQLRNLPGEFVLLLAMNGIEPAGTVALRALRKETCEVKRLYVPARFRGHGLGKRLMHKVIAEAQQMGYRAMFCDTLNTMPEAAKLYDGLGFARVGPYTDDPTPSAIYFKLDLQNGAA